jgi:hypothetical protein
VPKHPVLDSYQDRLSQVHELRPIWRTTGPGALTAVLGKARSSDVERLPAWTFFTTSLMGEPVSGGDPYARHLWSTTAERWGYPGATPYPDGGPR